MAIVERDGGLTIRRPTMDDVEAVAALVRACEVADDGTSEYTADELCQEWQSRDLAASAWIVETDDGTGTPAGYAEIDHEQHVRIYGYIRVHPDFCGRGIDARLLRVVEESAAGHVSLAPPGARVLLALGAAGRDDAARALMEAAGYRRVRSFWRMMIDLDAPPPEPQWPGGITLRPFVAGRDDRTVFAAVEEAFEDHWNHTPDVFEEWKDRRMVKNHFDPSLWFLAMDGDEIAGAALCRYRGDLGWVGQLAVRRPWRRCGLGRALLYQAFGEFYRRGRHKVGLGVDADSLTGATRLYEGAGMRVAHQMDRYDKVLREGAET